MKLAIALLVFFSATSLADSLRFIGTDSKPYYYYDEIEKSFKGPAIDFHNDISRESGISFNYSRAPLSRLKYLIDNKIADGIVGIIKTKEKEKWLKFTNQPILENFNFFILINQEYQMNYNTFKNSNLKICFRSGYIKIPLFDDSRWHIIHGKEINERLLKLVKSGRCDSIIISNIDLQEDRLHTHNIDKNKNLIKIPHINDHVYIALGNHVSDIYIKKIDNAIKKLKKEGKTYEYYHNKFHKNKTQ